MLKTAIPEQVWRRHVCLIVHPGIKGDRGPSSLEWAMLMNAAAEWGVTVLQAEAEMDAGPIWAAETFPMPRQPMTKSSLYRSVVTEAAVRAVLWRLSRVWRRGASRPSDWTTAVPMGVGSCARLCDSVTVQSIGRCTQRRRSRDGYARRTAVPGC